MSNIHYMSDDRIKESNYLKLYSDDKIYWETIIRLIDENPTDNMDFAGNTPDELEDNIDSYYFACRDIDYYFTMILPAFVKAEELIKSGKIKIGYWDHQRHPEKYPIENDQHIFISIDRLNCLLDNWLNESDTLFDCIGLMNKECYKGFDLYMHRLIFKAIPIFSVMHDFCLDAISCDADEMEKLFKHYDLGEDIKNE